MKALKKYLTILFLILAFPFFRFIANHFILSPSNEIYAYVPQESDFIIEINTRNFIQEILYQRVYAEKYFNEKVYPEDDDETPQEKWVESGIDIFNKIVCFREQWANEAVWYAILKHNNVEQIKSFILGANPEALFEVNNEYAILQLTPGEKSPQRVEHLKKISNKEVKSFRERKNLPQLFDSKKEINCFVIPKQSEYNNLLEGYFSFDFKKDKIEIDGEFTPISGLSEFKPIAYELNQEAAISLRSSLNLFNSIYWFDDHSIKNVPEFTQLALDYNGVECQMIHRNQGYATPFYTLPKAQVRFNILKPQVWNSFMDSLIASPAVDVDTTKQRLTTHEGASFGYRQNSQVFELMQDSVNFSPLTTDKNLFFDLYMNLDKIIDGTKFTIHPQFPPSDLEQTMGMVVASNLMAEIKSISSMESIIFQIAAGENETIDVHGEVIMKEKGGHSTVELISFASLLFNFIGSY